MIIEDEQLDELIDEVSSCNNQNLFILLEAVIDDIFGSNFPEDAKEQMRNRILTRIQEEI